MVRTFKIYSLTTGLRRVGHDLVTEQQQLLPTWFSQVTLVVKNPPTNVGDARDTGLISGSGRSPSVGSGNTLHYSCLEDSKDRGDWQAEEPGDIQSMGLQSQT